jgi:hypothetical protein
MPRRSMKKNNRNRKTRKWGSRGGTKPFTTHVKTVIYNSKVRPGKPFYKTFVFDEINGNFFEGLQKFMINTVDETEEDLIAMREAWNKRNNKDGKDDKGKKKQPQDVIVYGYKITPN